MRHEDIVTYSRNVFLPVSNICRNRCAYCGFRGRPNNGGWLLTTSEVLSMAWVGKLCGCTEALITTGERPDFFLSVKERLREWGFRDFTHYVEHLCKSLLRLDMLPHVNLGVLSKHELRRLKRWCASMGLMLECATPLPAHAHSPGKTPAFRLATIEAAGELRIPFTTGILVGVGESERDRMFSLHLIRELHDRYGHIQEVIVQPFEPKPNTPMHAWKPPAWRAVLRTVRAATRILPGVPIQFPPNLLHLYGFFERRVRELLRAGVRDFGGISPITPDFVNPRAPWPSAERLRAAILRAGFQPRERLPLYPCYVERRWMSAEVKRVVDRISDEAGYRN